MTQKYNSWVYTKGTVNRDSNRYPKTNVHSSIIHDNQNVETAQVSIKTDDGINKMWLYTEYYSDIKNNEILIYATISMGYEIMLIQITRTHKVIYYGSTYISFLE